MAGNTAAENRIEDYALIGDMRTAALVGRNGSIDWLCLPRFDAPACFAAMLGTVDNGRWLLAPRSGKAEVRRWYRHDTLVLETEFQTAEGRVAVIDFMPYKRVHESTEVIRIVEGRAGEVAMRTELVFRFDYGKVIPWVRRSADGLSAIAGPIAVHLRTTAPLKGEDFRTVGEFSVREGERVSFVMNCSPSHLPEPSPSDPGDSLAETEARWRDWAGQCTYDGPWRDEVVRSLITLKALTYKPTGGIIAAPTTSLPEELGGVRNWDYRCCWLRDATFTLYAFLISGFRAEARQWREWLLRAVAGTPAQLQPLYGLAGERRSLEFELPWLKGYADSRPVRVGNGAVDQFQLDIYGELMDVFHNARSHGIEPMDHTWRLQRALVEFLEDNWERPDAGLWEMRGPERHFTHSKVMSWVALDRALKAGPAFERDGELERWTNLSHRIHDQICTEAYDEKRNSFVQYYGGEGLDAALLLIPVLGFLPSDDPRVSGTVAAIQKELTVDGLVRRYIPEETSDGLPGGEGVFLACSFWMADNLQLLGRHEEAVEMFERLLALTNDVGLMAEEYDPREKRFSGNFPQAFSHIALVNTAYNLWKLHGPSEQRSRE